MTTERDIGRIEGKLDLVIEELTETKKIVMGLRLWRASVMGIAGAVGAVSGWIAAFLGK